MNIKGNTNGIFNLVKFRKAKAVKINTYFNSLCSIQTASESQETLVALKPNDPFLPFTRFIPSSGYILRAKSNFTISDAPTYSLTRSAASVNEGGSVTFTMTTLNVDDGTIVPYTITGVSTSDIGGASLTGNFTINNDTASVTLNITADSTTEGAETLTMTSGGGSTASVTINDTSTTPAPTYSLTRSAASVNEGGSVTFTMTTTNVANGTTVPYTISGVSTSDIGGASLNGNFTINSNSGSVTLNITADSTTEGAETLTMTSASQTASVTINDTSTTPAPPPPPPPPPPSPTYNLTASRSIAGEVSMGVDQNVIVFTMSTTNVGNGTAVPYSITGISASDLSSGSLNGNFTINNGSGTVTIVIASDNTTEGNETLTMTSGGQTVNVSIIDDSKPIWVGGFDKSTVNEGESILLTITGVYQNGGAAANVVLPYTITGVSTSDIGGEPLTGNFTSSSTGGVQKTFNITADTTTEGSETFTITISPPNYGGATITASCTIGDTSLDGPKIQFMNWPTANVDYGTSVNENTGIIIKYTDNTKPNGTNVTATLAGTTEIASSSVAINNMQNGVGFSGVIYIRGGSGSSNTTLTCTIGSVSKTLNITNVGGVAITNANYPLLATSWVSTTTPLDSVSITPSNYSIGTEGGSVNLIGGGISGVTNITISSPYWQTSNCTFNFVYWTSLQTIGLAMTQRAGITLGGNTALVDMRIDQGAGTAPDLSQAPNLNKIDIGGSYNQTQVNTMLAALVANNKSNGTLWGATALVNASPSKITLLNRGWTINLT